MKLARVLKKSFKCIFLFVIMFIIIAGLGCSYVKNHKFFNKREFQYQILIKPATITTYEARELLLFSAKDIEWNEANKTLTIEGKKHHSLRKEELTQVVSSYLEYDGKTSIIFYPWITYYIYKNGKLFKYIPSLYR